LRFIAFLLGCMTFAATAQDERPAPFITTPDDVVERMLRLAGTGAQDLVIDLGSGDGRIVIAAARRFGARGLGIELNPELVKKSRENARAAGVAERATFVEGDVLVADISQATVVTVYLLPGLLRKLQARFIDELKPGTRVVSHAFPLVSWKPDRAETMRIAKPHPGQGDESTLYLWIVPAEVRGRWRGEGGELRIHQNYPEIEIDGAANATLRGSDISWQAQGMRYRGRVAGDRIAGEARRGTQARPFAFTRVR
jgi:SAM-dependent methyltransferase